MLDQPTVDALLTQKNQAEIHRQLAWNVMAHGCAWGWIFTAGQWAMLLTALKIMGVW